MRHGGTALRRHLSTNLSLSQGRVALPGPVSERWRHSATLSAPRGREPSADYCASCGTVGCEANKCPAIYEKLARPAEYTSGSTLDWECGHCFEC